MHKKMLLLALAMAAAIGSLSTPRATAGLIGGGPYHDCPVCTTFENGSQCCITCRCGASGSPVLCPEIACVPFP